MRSSKTYFYLMTTLMTTVIVSSLLCAGLAFAQASQTYKADLRVVPLSNAAGRANIDESSSVFARASATATLSGTKLSVNGTFEGFKSPAAIAQIHTGPVMGSRGPVVFDLTVTKETKGTFNGTFDLTPAQVDLLKNGRLYIQIHNTNTPEGALWGWLLK